MKTLRQGFTLVEILIAMAVLSIVLSLAFGTITSGLQGQRVSETNVASQAKLRRVLDVISQDIRGSVFGTISNKPYVNTDSSISLALIAGGAGYQTLQQGVSPILLPGTLEFVSDGTPNLGGETLLLNYEGIGALFTPSSFSQNSNGYWRTTFPICGVINYTDNTLLYRISTMGYRYDSASRTLYFRAAGATVEQPLAYDIDDFNISYLYVNLTTNAVTELSAPKMENGIPQKSYLVTRPSPEADQQVVLRQIKLHIVTIQTVGRRQITRSFQSIVDLGYSQALNVKEIRSCS